jgi:putative phage-type endonuclease
MCQKTQSQLKEIIMQQNTKTWMQWRRQGIGASDAPIIFGESPYMTPYQLWNQKVFGYEEGDTGSNFVTELGHRFEPMCRADIELGLGYSMQPGCVEHEEFPWIRASLDGYSEENRIFCEIKYVGKEKLELAKEGIVPTAHWIQMQHQFMVTGFPKGIYACYTLNDGKSSIEQMAQVRVDPDPKFITEKLFPKLKVFWDQVRTQTQPVLTDKDVRKVDAASALHTAEVYRQLMKKQKELELQINEVKSELLSLQHGHAITKIGSITIQTITRKGNVDYGKIPELKKLDLEKYRKPSTMYAKICL